ncbi:PEP-CTERM sorting domain-containing protein [Limnofasciculus baicalensis]|uniref:PEP-CTERM sorting domain-containing protein n=1 Tax=Limnofasciculus baicalensis BBK-W-15 TaxID=2699891 RepID=A0AAE3KKV7_9CYAN|nr:PEP-CTERM sorting domain-containing protein [Limnofasciculus baicalensis]MCP2727424.1 PEP-CTERM sorting domain-containing protein [Limnofasciculus baicalensis BBK-W-15]
MKTINTPLLIGLQIATVSAAVMTAYPSNAAILSFTGQVKPLITSPTPKIMQDNLLQAFNEKQNFLLTQDIQTSNPNDWSKLLPGIPQGTRISSHYIYLNPLKKPIQFVNAAATFIFDAPILGVIGTHNQLLATNNLLGLSGVNYPGNTKFGARQLDNKNPNGSKDTATFLNNILNINFTARDGIDPIRVITTYLEPTPASTSTPSVSGMVLGDYGSYLDSETVSVPEPLMAMGSTVAVALGMLLKRKRAN